MADRILITILVKERFESETIIIYPVILIFTRYQTLEL
jgi:hypothetical protein